MPDPTVPVPAVPDPSVVLRELGAPAGEPDAPLLVVGPSLGTAVGTLWGPCAARLADRFRVVGWELPGHGGTRPATGFDLAGLAAGVLAALDEAGHTGAFHCAGDSVGGVVALHLALLAPQRVRTVALACSGARIGTAQSWAERAATVREGGTAALLPGTPARWFGPGFAERDPSLAQALLDGLAGTDDASYAAVCAALARCDLRPRLAGIAAPVLAIAGDSDVTTPVASLRHVAGGVPHGRLVVLDDVGHLAPAEAPDRVAELLAAHALAPAPEDRTVAQVRADGMRVRREVLGDAWVDAASARVGELTGEFQELLTQWAWGTVWTRPGLDRRSRSIVTVTALVAGGHHEELAGHLRAARNNGLSWEELREVLIQTAVYCSVPAANAAFRVAAGVYSDEASETTG